VFNAGFYDDDDGPGAGTSRFVISASNNACRSGAFPKNPDKDPIAVGQTGWYTFEHLFRNDGGVLAVDMTIRDSSGGLVKTWTRSDPTDLIDVTVGGGNRYGWFPINEFTTLAFDNTERICFTTEPMCHYRVTRVARVLGGCRPSDCKRWLHHVRCIGSCDPAAPHCDVRRPATVPCPNPNVPNGACRVVAELDDGCVEECIETAP
jgi:hypothetical protein